MKVCNIQSKKNRRKIKDIEKYLTNKWKTSFGDKNINISTKKLLYPRSAFKTRKVSATQARSLPQTLQSTSSRQSGTSRKATVRRARSLPQTLRSTSPRQSGTSRKTKKISRSL